MNIMNKIVGYFKQSKDELKKVAWLSRKEVTSHTWVVVGVSVGTAAFLGLIDYLFNLGFERLIGLG